MKYKNEDLIKEISKAKKNKKNLTLITDKSTLSKEEKDKISVCREFVKYAILKKLTTEHFAKLLGIPTKKMSLILNYKVNKLTDNELAQNLILLAKINK